MKVLRQLPVFILSFLLCGHCFADEQNEQADVRLTSTALASLSAVAWLAELEHAPYSFSNHDFSARHPYHNWYDTTQISFQDGSFVGRVKKIRSVSLLTLAEVGKTRFFLGVDDDGLVGLHFRVFANADQNRNLELARAPWVEARLNLH